MTSHLMDFSTRWICLLLALFAVALADPSPTSPDHSGPTDPPFVVPFDDYPVYKQCDHRWGNHFMGNKTICDVGCFMCSVSAAVRQHGIWFKLPDYFGEMPVTSNPGTFNQWLRENGGYDNNMFISPVVSALCNAFPERPCAAEYVKGHLDNDLTIDEVRDLLREHVTVLAHVKNKEHFVRVMGWNADYPDAFYVMDPGFKRAVYSHMDDIMGWRIFALAGPYTPSTPERMRTAVRRVLGDKFTRFVPLEAATKELIAEDEAIATAFAKSSKSVVSAAAAAVAVATTASAGKQANGDSGIVDLPLPEGQVIGEPVKEVVNDLFSDPREIASLVGL